MPEPIYLDHNATTPLLPEALDAMLPFLRDKYGNPSSKHAYGKSAREAVDRAREQVAALIGASPEEIYFTSGGTEANNLAIRGVAEAYYYRKRIITTNIEHPAVSEVCEQLEQRGYEVVRAPVGQNGRIRVEDVESAIEKGTLLVTVMHAQNETGVLQPVVEIGRWAREKGVLFHVDGAQSVGKVRVNVDEMNVDLLSIAAHKLYGPKGVGALYIRKGVEVRKLTFGASHERRLRPGTENVPGIVGLGVACEAAARDADWLGDLTAMMRDRLWSKLRAEVPGLEMNGDPEERLPNTLSVRFPGVLGPTLLEAVPEIAASTGSACHAGSFVAPAVLVAMGIPQQEAMGTVRLSVGRHTTDAEVDRAAGALASAWRKLVEHAG